MHTAEVNHQIGNILRDARLRSGYRSRNAFVKTKGLRGKLTGEGLRKIERGERIPRFENIRLLGQVLGLNEKTIHQLEKMALEKGVERVSRRAGNVPVTFRIEGKPIRVATLPPRRKVEAFAREVVGELLNVVYRYGVMEEDLNHFRMTARDILIKKLS